MIRPAPAALLVLLACARPAPADNVSWSGSSNNWSNASSWTPHAPTSLDEAFLGTNGGGNYTVTYTGAGTNTARSVNVNAGNATFRQQSGAGGTFTLTDANVTAGLFDQFTGALTVSNIAVTGGNFTVSGGSATLSGTATVGGTGAFNLNGGTFSGGTITVNNSGFNWGGGTLGSTTAINNGGALSTGGTKIIGNGGNVTLVGGTTTFTGTLEYNGTGSFTVGNGATFSFQSDASITRNAGYAGAAPLTVQTGGTLVKALGGGTSTLSAGLTVTNAGTIRNSSPSSILSVATSVTNSGTLTADATTTMRFTSGTLTLNTGSAFTGGGLFQLLGGTNASAVFEVAANTSAAAGGTMRLEVGTVQSSTGSTLTVNGTLSWKEALIGGNVVVKATNGGLVNGNAHIGTGTVQLNAGTFSWTNSDINFDGSGKLQIDAGATLSHAGNNGFVRTAGSPVLQIDGTLEKASGIGSLTIPAGVTANNTGLVRVLATRIDMAGTFNNTGTIHTASGTGFWIVGSGAANFNAGTNVTGTGGLIRLDGVGAALNLNTAVSSDGGLTFINGTINGPGTLNLAGPFDFGVSSGGVAGGTINAAGGGSWSSGGTRQINGGAVNLTGGTFTMLDTNVSFGGTGALTVGAAGTLDLTGNGSILRTAGSPTFTVNGVFQKSGGTGTSTVGASITTAIGAGGLVDVSSGTLRVQSNVTNNGTLRSSSGGTILFDQPVTLSGTGLVNVAGGTLTVSNGTVQIPANMTFTNDGTVQTAQVTSAGTLTINATANLTNFSAGTLTGGTWKATAGAINLGGRQITTLAAGTVVELSGAGQLVGLASLTQNNGQLRILSGSTNITGTVFNAGLMQVSGTLNGTVVVQNGGGLGGNGTINGNVTVQSGGLVSPGPGPYTFPGTGQFSLGTTALNGGSEYVWELSSWSTTPNAGTDFDQVRGGTSGAKLNLAGASSGNRVTLRVVSLSGGLPGLISGFDPETLRSWVIADYSNGNATGGVLNFSADKFTIDTGLFGNDPGTGQFSLGLDGTGSKVVLTYNPVPEPASVLLAAAAALGVRRLRRSKTNP